LTLQRKKKRASIGSPWSVEEDSDTRQRNKCSRGPTEEETVIFGSYLSVPEEQPFLFSVKPLKP
jgi:hypothetical protein